jgi:hypothetical protein
LEYDTVRVLSSYYIKSKDIWDFIASSLPCVEDGSDGCSILFHVQDLEYLHDIPAAVKAQEAFRRLGPSVTDLLGRAEEDPLVWKMETSFLGRPS